MDLDVNSANGIAAPIGSIANYFENWKPDPKALDRDSAV
jgi:hypothetical protein